MRTEEIFIREVKKSDLKLLQEIGRQTFKETFEHENTESDMEEYLRTSFHDDKLISELTNPGSKFYFATISEKVIAYLKINTGQAQTEKVFTNGLEIERIYVLSEYQGKKVGQLLYNKAIEIAKSGNYDIVWLGVWEHNQKALNFYKKNGFEPFDQHIFKLGEDEQIDILMKLELNNQVNALKSVT